MVTIFEPNYFNGVRQHILGHFLTSAKLISGALTDQGRRLQFGEVRCTQIFGFSRWMKGIT
jgi:hypothetical protein